MELGVFSMSLAVEDLATSKAFYEKLGFEATGGDGEGYLIMVNGETVIGLFQGMFDGNILTFNPGWKGPGRATGDDFLDVREIAARLEAAGLELTTRSIEGESGPGHIVLVDPDGNAVLIDQHR
jgi:catechol 2,3-dioxygenase-like lactoylglutathione lyase family enzyme